MDGATTGRPDTTDAKFHATLRAVGGTGKYVNAAGTGRLSGIRDAQLGGGAVMVTAQVRLSGVAR